MLNSLGPKIKLKKNWSFQMCVKQAFIYLIFCYAFKNISSIKICCNPQSILYKIHGSNNLTTYNCTNSLEIVNETHNANTIDLVGTTESPQGYGLQQIYDTEFPKCEHTGYSNVSLSTEISLSLLASSCILIIDNSSLISLTCQLKTDNNILQSIGIINKCCPHGYSFGAEMNKCYLRDPDYDKYAAIFDNPVVFVDNSFKCPKSKVLVEYVLTAEAIVITNEKMLLKEHKKSFQRSEFCIEAIEGLIKNGSSEINNNTQQFIVRTCQQLKICDSVPCVRKCCYDSEIYAKGNLTTFCTRDEHSFQFHSINSMNTSGVFSKPSVFGVLTGLECPKFRLDPDSFPDEFHVISASTGSLLITSTNKIYSNSQYCIEKIRNSSFADQKLYTFLCFDSKVVSNDRIRFRMYPVGLLISCCFYIITLLVYSSIEKLRNLPGKILICLVSSLLFAYLGIALGQLLPTSNNDICFMSGCFVYFFLMAAFSWMNITCFDIWKTFGSTESANLQKKERQSRFLWYSLYGWGMPTVLTSITAALSKSDVLTENIRPIFGHGRCWFTYDTIGYASLVFFSGPLGVLFIINLVFFLLTLKYCNKVKREIFRMQSSNTEKHTLRRRFFMDKTRFIMNTKLCFVMGITWLLEIASILFYDHKKNFFWSISDSFNVLLGVFVFIIFVFKRRVWKEITVKFGLWSSNDRRGTPNATCLTQSTCVNQSISLKKLGDNKGDEPLIRRST